MSYLHNPPAFIIAQTAIGRYYHWVTGKSKKDKPMKCLNVRFDAKTGYAYYMLAGEFSWTRADFVYEAEPVGVQ